MIFEFFIASRYLRSKNRSGYLSFLALIALGGVFVSVFSFLIIHAVMNGFSTHLKDSLIGFDNHITVSSFKNEEQKKELMTWLHHRKGLLTQEEIVEGDGIIMTGGFDSAGVKIRGIDFKNEEKGTLSRINPLYFTEDDFPEGKGSSPMVLVGEEIYSRLHLFPGQVEEISLVYPVGDVGPTGEVEPRSRNYQIAGVFSTGFFGVDARYVMMSYPEAQWFTGFDPSSMALHLGMKKLSQVQGMAFALRKKFPELKIETWIEKNRRLFSALKLERGGMFLLLGMVTVIATFNIFALVTLLSMQKLKEVALLRALGLSRNRVTAIFVVSGMFLGIAGSSLGFLFGVGVLHWLENHPWPLPSAYYLDYLPVLLDPKMSIMALMMAPFFAVGASLWPAFKASQCRPHDLLK